MSLFGFFSWRTWVLSWAPAGVLSAGAPRVAQRNVGLGKRKNQSCGSSETTLGLLSLLPQLRLFHWLNPTFRCATRGAPALRTPAGAQLSILKLMTLSAAERGVMSMY